MARILDATAESALVAGEPPSWLAQLQQASFRGVPFQVDAIDWTGGDNVVLREYPFQDLPTVFRMGAAAQELKFSAYVIGDDYHLQRAALMSALTGEGMLMHPTAGAMRVFVAGKYTVKEHPTAEGGMARFDLHFVRADARRYPVGVVNTSAAATIASAVAKASAVDAFAAQWSLTATPGWAAERAVTRLKDSLDVAMATLAGAARSLGAYNTMLITRYQALRGGLDGLLAAPRQLADSVATLFELPGQLKNAGARDLQSAFAFVFSVRARIKATGYEVSVMPAVGAGLVMYGTGNADLLATDSAARVRLTALSSASDRLIDGLATAAWVEATASVELGNYDEALAMRGALTNQLMRLLGEASASAAPQVLPASNWHDTMLGLYTAGLADLQARSRDLVRLTSYTPEGWQPVWYISYRLFGTAAYADEILAMNPHITHPLLVPPGRPLRILRRD